MKTRNFPAIGQQFKTLGVIVASVAFSALIATAAQAASVNVKGNVQQDANFDRSPVTSTAVGNRVKSELRVNDVSGDTTIGGNLTQNLRANRSPMTAAAIGNRAEATLTANTVRGGR